MAARTHRVALGALGAVVAAAVVLLLVALREPARDSVVAARGRGAEAAPTEAPSPAMPRLSVEAAPGDEPPAVMASGRPFWRPGADHWYGPDDDPFIRQPHDYPPGMPELLGDGISVHVFDLERVQDMVRRGVEPDSEIAVLKGRPLDAAEHARARAALQAFFDDTVPIVDGVVAGTTTREEALAVIGPGRARLNERLRQALGLSPGELAALWPHIAGS